MKIQYFQSDLSHKLGIGEILEMHIDMIADDKTKMLVPVLRIECKDVDKDEYKTVRVAKQTSERKSKAAAKADRIVKRIPVNFEKLIQGPDFW